MRRIGAGGMFGVAGVQRELALALPRLGLALPRTVLALPRTVLALAVPVRIPRIPERSLGRGL